jgi:MFS family permease
MNSIFGISIILVMIPAGWLADKAGERVNIALAFFFIFIAIGMMAVLPPASPAGLYGISWMVGGLGVGLANPAYQSLISKAVPQRLRGVAFGLFSTSLGLVSLPAPMIGGYLWENISPQFPFMLTAIVSLVSIVPVWLKFKFENKAEIDSPSQPEPPQ